MPETTAETSQFRDYYELLGVERNATQEEIKKAYRRLALKFHPDKSNKSDATEECQEINIAYDTLSNSNQKAAYNYWLGHVWQKESSHTEAWQKWYSLHGSLFSQNTQTQPASSQPHQQRQQPPNYNKQQQEARREHQKKEEDLRKKRERARKNSEKRHNNKQQSLDKKIEQHKKKQKKTWKGLSEEQKLKFAVNYKTIAQILTLHLKQLGTRFDNELLNSFLYADSAEDLFKRIYDSADQTVSIILCFNRRFDASNYEAQAKKLNPVSMSTIFSKTSIAKWQQLNPTLLHWAANNIEVSRSLATPVVVFKIKLDYLEDMITFLDPVTYHFKDQNHNNNLNNLLNALAEMPEKKYYSAIYGNFYPQLTESIKKLFQFNQFELKQTEQKIVISFVTLLEQLNQLETAVRNSTEIDGATQINIQSKISTEKKAVLDFMKSGKAHELQERQTFANQRRQGIKTIQRQLPVNWRGDSTAIRIIIATLAIIGTLGIACLIKSSIWTNMGSGYREADQAQQAAKETAACTA